MSGKRKLGKTAKRIDKTKEDVITYVPALLGLAIDGSQQVAISSRPGFVYARMRSNLNEVVHAYNDTVPAVYNLPVLLARNKTNKTIWYVVGRDVGRYSDWGTSTFVPDHHTKHQFDPNYPGGDITWIYDRQIMPHLIYPSGSGAGCVLVSPHPYYCSGSWHYSGLQATSSLLSYKPTGSNARVVFVYMDYDDAAKILVGDYLAENLTGTASIVAALPSMPTTTADPIGAVRLVSGTSNIGWNNIYDLRQFHSKNNGGTATVNGHTIQDEGASKTQRTNLNFIGTNVQAVDNVGTDSTDVYIYANTGTVPTFTTGSIPFSGADGILKEDNPEIFWSSDQKALFIGDNSLPFSSTAKFRLINISGSAIYTVLSYNGGISTFAGYSARGTKANPTGCLAGDTLWQASVGSYDGTVWENAGAFIKGIASENHNTSGHGIFWRFVAAETGSTTISDPALDIYPTRAIFQKDIALKQTGTNAGYYHGDPYVDGSWRTSIQSDVFSIQKRVNGAWTTQNAGFDDTAIHDNLADEIVGITEKTVPTTDDWLLIEDAADSNTKKRAKINNLPFVGGTPTIVVTGTVSHSICQGKLTLKSGDPTPTTDVTGTSTIYYALDIGNMIGLYDGVSAWMAYSFTERSITPTGTIANTNYDVFAYNITGTVNLELLAWTNDTTRAVALTKIDGIYLKATDTTRRYLGTVGTDSKNEFVDIQSPAKRFVWNYYNRVIRTARISNSTGHGYGNNVWRSWNADDTVRATFVIGLVEEAIIMGLWTDLSNSIDGKRLDVSVGYDVNNNYLGKLNGVLENANLQRMRIGTTTSHIPDIGRHYYQVVENAASSTTGSFNAVEFEAYIYG